MASTLSQSFSKAAPPYEPELWNGHVTNDQILGFLQSHRPLVTSILKSDEHNPEMALERAPLYRTQQAIVLFNKAVETLGDDAKVAEKFGIDKKDVTTLKQTMQDLYLGQGFRDYSNCYRYGMNNPTRYEHGGATPGARGASVPGAPNYEAARMESARLKDYQGYKDNLIKGVEADGATIGGKDAQPIEGYYRMAVYAMPPEKMPKGDNGFSDPHFVRENADGTWSHKQGAKPVKNTDSNGQVITDPKTADLGGYEFITYVYVPEGGLDVGVGWAPKTKAASVDVPLDPVENWKRRNADPYPTTTR